MSRRAIWKGVITFGKERVPVKLYSAVEDRSISFHLLHDEDKVRLRRQMVCEVEDKPVPNEEIVKGLEIGDGEYVLVSPEELAELEPAPDRSIEIDRFCPAEEVDNRYYDRPYHLGPDGKEASYAALASALDGSGSVGICRWSFRKRSYVGALMSDGRVLSLSTLRDADAVSPAETLDIGEAELSERERKTARYLVEELTADFDPSRYHDDFQEAIRQLIRKKIEGGEVERRKAEPPEATEADDLMKQLEASLEAARKGGKGQGGREPGKYAKASGKAKEKSRKAGSGRNEPGRYVKAKKKPSDARGRSK